MAEPIKAPKLFNEETETDAELGEKRTGTLSREPLKNE